MAKASCYMAQMENLTMANTPGIQALSPLVRSYFDSFSFVSFCSCVAYFAFDSVCEGALETSTMANGCIINGMAVVHTHGQVERY